MQEQRLIKYHEKKYKPKIAPWARKTSAVINNLPQASALRDHSEISLPSLMMKDKEFNAIIISLSSLIVLYNESDITVGFNYWSFNFMNNMITDCSMPAFASFIFSCPSIHNIDLRNNLLTPVGISYLINAIADRKSKVAGKPFAGRVVTLKLQGNRINRQVLLAMLADAELHNSIDVDIDGDSSEPYTEEDKKLIRPQTAPDRMSSNGTILK